MAARPWVTPQEVREYSEIKSVQKRNDARLVVDISRAEQYVITLTHNDFSSYKEIPASVKTAVLILAEAYAHNAVLLSNNKKSETFDDYSYTAESSGIPLDSLDISSLLDAYVLNESKNNINMRLRKL